MALWQTLLIGICALVIVTVAGTFLGRFLSNKWAWPFSKKSKIITTSGDTVSPDEVIVTPIQEVAKKNWVRANGDQTHSTKIESPAAQTPKQSDANAIFENLQAERRSLLQEKMRQESERLAAAKFNQAKKKQESVLQDFQASVEKARLETQLRTEKPANAPVRNIAAEIERQNKEKAARLEAEQLARDKKDGQMTKATPLATPALPAIGQMALQEIQMNIDVAMTPWSGKVIPFKSNVWDNNIAEFKGLSTEQRVDIKEAYTDIAMANNIAWLVNEVHSSSRELTDGYHNLCLKINERLTRVLRT